MRTQFIVTMDYERGTENQVQRLLRDIIDNAIDTGEYKEYSDVEWPALVDVKPNTSSFPPKVDKVLTFAERYGVNAEKFEKLTRNTKVDKG